MCLAVPMRVIMRESDKGTVEAGGVNYQVNFRLLPEVVVGDYVLVHAGFAIQKLDTDAAEETLALFREMDDIEKDTGN